MQITETIEKRALEITLGAHEAPASYHWRAIRFLRNEDGSDAAPPQAVSIPATAEEVASHIGATVPKLLADIAADTERYADGLKKRKADYDAQKAELQAVLDQVCGERDAAQRERDALAAELQLLRPRKAN